MDLIDDHNPALHRVAVATAVATFPLIFMGGLVTSHAAGMSVPDWPNSYGYNMFLFPPNQWVGGILYEHTHRLMGTIVGFLAVVLVLVAFGPAARSKPRKILVGLTAISALLAVLAGLILLTFAVGRISYAPTVKSNVTHAGVGAVGVALVAGIALLCRRPDPRQHVRLLCLAVLASVILQGVLGGLRVVLVELDLAIVHACFAQAFFSLTAITALVTSRGWTQLPNLRGAMRPNLARWAAVLPALVFAQLIAGAVMRHNDAGLAIPDLPLHYGKLVPPTDQTALDAANRWRARSGSPDLRPVDLEQIWLHMAHRVGAVIVSLGAIVVIAKAWRAQPLRPFVAIPACLLAVLLLTQLTLGVLTVLLHKPADVASVHVAVGALVLVTSVVLAARCIQVLGLRDAAAVGSKADVSSAPYGVPGRV